LALYLQAREDAAEKREIFDKRMIQGQ